MHTPVFQHVKQMLARYECPLGVNLKTYFSHTFALEKSLLVEWFLSADDMFLSNASASFCRGILQSQRVRSRLKWQFLLSLPSCCRIHSWHSSGSPLHQEQHFVESSGVLWEEGGRKIPSCHWKIYSNPVH